MRNFLDVVLSIKTAMCALVFIITIVLVYSLWRLTLCIVLVVRALGSGDSCLKSSACDRLDKSLCSRFGSLSV